MKEKTNLGFFYLNQIKNHLGDTLYNLIHKIKVTKNKNKMN